MSRKLGAPALPCTFQADGGEWCFWTNRVKQVGNAAERRDGKAREADVCV